MSWFRAEGVKLFPGEEFSASEGIALQKKLRSELILKWDGRPVRFIAGADVHFPSRDTALAAIAVFSFPGLEMVESGHRSCRCEIPYIPGLLSFREIPAILQALENIKKKPDIILCDGQGVAHPRRLGLASHLGILLGIPTIGCAKSPLYGKFDLPGGKKGDKSPILGGDDDLLGYVLRTREGVKPVYISPGHLIDHRKSVEIVLKATPRYKISEPLRSAHRIASEYK
ncbi:MAG: endonuclease V [Candidatus Latescibacteria bacterium]|nr:endonuclease V [bacterium]MBD3423959.1 endonuclease V [Candidatus Latescibacterota bacterium]